MSFELEQLREAAEKYTYHQLAGTGLAEARMGTETDVFSRVLKL